MMMIVDLSGSTVPFGQCAADLEEIERGSA